MSDKLKEKVEDVKEGTKENVEKAKEVVSEKVEDVKEGIKEKAEDVKEKISNETVCSFFSKISFIFINLLPPFSPFLLFYYKN